MLLTSQTNQKSFIGSLGGYGQLALGNYTIGTLRENNNSGILFNGNAPMVPASVSENNETTQQLQSKICSIEQMLHTLIDRGAPASEEYDHLIEHEICHYMNAFVNDNENIISYLFRKDNYDDLICRINELQEKQESDTHEKCLSLVYKSIAVAQKAYQIKNNLSQQVKTLTDKLNEKRKNASYTNIEITTPHIEYELDMFVVQYIIRYGMPTNGIFDPEKYALLKKELENKPTKEWDWTIRHQNNDSSSSSSDSCSRSETSSNTNESSSETDSSSNSDQASVSSESCSHSETDSISNGDQASVSSESCSHSETDSNSNGDQTSVSSESYSQSETDSTSNGDDSDETDSQTSSNENDDV